MIVVDGSVWISDLLPLNIDHVVDEEAV